MQRRSRGRSTNNSSFRRRTSEVDQITKKKNRTTKFGSFCLYRHIRLDLVSDLLSNLYLVFVLDILVKFHKVVYSRLVLLGDLTEIVACLDDIDVVICLFVNLLHNILLGS